MKKLMTFFLTLCLLFVWGSMAVADGTPEVLPDAKAEQLTPVAPVYYCNDLYMITSAEHAQLEQKLADIGTAYGIDAVIFLVESLGEERLSEYSERIYREGIRDGLYQTEGIVLGFSRAEKLWGIYATERASNLLSDQDKRDLWDAYRNGNGSYNAAINYADALATHLQTTGVQPIPEERQLPRLVDEADLFTAEQEETLLARLDEVSKRQQCDVIIVTVPSLGGKEPMAYADDFFDYNGYGYGEDDDGILYLLSMEFRDQAYSTYGFAIPAFTDAGQDYIFALMRDDLKKDDWYSAFTKYIPLCDEFLTVARNGDPYDIHNLPKTPDDIKNSIITHCLFGAIILAVCGLVASSLVSAIERKTASGGVMKTVMASEYMVAGSLHLTRTDETFLNQTESKTRRIKYTSSGSGGGSSSGGSSTHTSSSGRSHGGSSNKF